MDDNESIDKSSLYHEPFNVNMYTSAASGCSLNDLQRHHVTPDYTGMSFINIICTLICTIQKEYTPSTYMCDYEDVRLSARLSFIVLVLFFPWILWAK